MKIDHDGFIFDFTDAINDGLVVVTSIRRFDEETKTQTPRWFRVDLIFSTPDAHYYCEVKDFKKHDASEYPTDRASSAVESPNAETQINHKNYARYHSIGLRNKYMQSWIYCSLEDQEHCHKPIYYVCLFENWPADSSSLGHLRSLVMRELHMDNKPLLRAQTWKPERHFVDKLYLLTIEHFNSNEQLKRLCSISKSLAPVPA